MYTIHKIYLLINHYKMTTRTMQAYNVIHVQRYQQKCREVDLVTPKQEVKARLSICRLNSSISKLQVDIHCATSSSYANFSLPTCKALLIAYSSSRECHKATTISASSVSGCVSSCGDIAGVSEWERSCKRLASRGDVDLIDIMPTCPL